jgi:hypothetical protein
MDKRESIRVPVELPVSFSGDGIAGGGLITNLSAHGCVMSSEELLVAGTPLALHISLPAQDTLLKVDLAEVRWVDGEQYGLEFDRLPLQEKRRLEQFLKALQRAKGGSTS